MSYQKRLEKVIPGGAHTYSRGKDQFPENAPQILSKGLGAYVWCPEGKQYLDYGMALRSVTLGYANPEINEAAINEINMGNNLTRASMTELKAAELLVDLIPSIDMVKFCKNGSNATTAAVKIARAYTNRRYICIPRQQPFFSFDDWFIGTTDIVRGIPQEGAISTLIFDYGDIDSLKNLFVQYPNEIAAVMLEPATTLIPCPNECSIELSYESPCFNCSCYSRNFLKQVETMCKKNSCLFILDEMISGFRWHLKGAQTYFGVTPDITTFGKGMANGFSVAAVGGRREVMEVGSIASSGQERTFLLSTTHGGEMSGLGAFLACVKIYKEKDVCNHLWNYGKKLRQSLLEVAKDFQLEDYFKIVGPDISLNYITYDKDYKISMDYRTLFAQEMIKNNVLIPWIAISLSHTQKELEITIEAAKNALKIYSYALNDGVEKHLNGPAIKPVFRKYN
jgi:glutamate-1-semialdehyde 2,1-aminomutase